RMTIIQTLSSFFMRFIIMIETFLPDDPEKRAGSRPCRAFPQTKLVQIPYDTKRVTHFMCAVKKNSLQLTEYYNLDDATKTGGISPGATV
ncbi:MAG: hypothetical protein IJD60_13025, partial [Clostridia bacterium]|nr:hypothetical protein [Clostridia bacterium]